MLGCAVLSRAVPYGGAVPSPAVPCRAVPSHAVPSPDVPCRPQTCHTWWDLHSSSGKSDAFSANLTVGTPAPPGFHPNPWCPPRWPLVTQDPRGAGGRGLSPAGAPGFPLGMLARATHGTVWGVTAACAPCPHHVCLICAESRCQCRAAPCPQRQRVMPGSPSWPGWACG